MSKKTQRKAAEINNNKISLRRHNKNKKLNHSPEKKKIKFRRSILSSSESLNDLNIKKNSPVQSNLNSKKKIQVEKIKDEEINDKVNSIILDENKHYDEIHVKKYDTYKQGKFKNKNMRSYGKSLDIYNLKYMEISSRYTVKPKKKLCEFTGLPAQFRCPYTRLYYYDSSVYKHLRQLSSDVITFIYKTKEIGKTFNPFNMTK